MGGFAIRSQRIVLMMVLSDLSSMSTQQTLLLSLVIIVLTITVVNIRRRRPKDGSPKQYRREIDAATTQSTAVRRDMETLLIELEELARKINAQIDTKFAKLEQSITDADRRVSALRILIEEAKRVRGENSPNAEPEDASKPSAPVQTPSHSPATAVPANEHSQASPSDRRRRVYELADAGRSAVEIARELGTQPGEVELILNLRIDTER